MGMRLTPGMACCGQTATTKAPCCEREEQAVGCAESITACAQATVCRSDRTMRAWLASTLRCPGPWSFISLGDDGGWHIGLSRSRR